MGEDVNLYTEIKQLKKGVRDQLDLPKKPKRPKGGRESKKTEKGKTKKVGFSARKSVVGVPFPRETLRRKEKESHS